MQAREVRAAKADGTTNFDGDEDQFAFAQNCTRMNLSAKNRRPRQVLTMSLDPIQRSALSGLRCREIVILRLPHQEQSKKCE
jgi:hypothetical protein